MLPLKENCKQQIKSDDSCPSSAQRLHFDNQKSEGYNEYLLHIEVKFCVTSCDYYL
jgi:hypothetical protein